MSEAKYKIGDEVTIWGKTPCKVEACRTYYDVRKLANDELVCGFRESDLSPYVRPLAVGDRVRHIPTGALGTIDAIRNGKACVWYGNGWDDWRIDSLERIPTEAGQ